MRGIWRFIAGLALILAIVAGAAWFARAPLAGAAMRYALAAAGVENPSLIVDEISFRRLALKDVAAGRDGRSPDLAVDTIEATFDWWTLLRHRRIDKAVIGPGAVVVRIDERGALNIAGYTPSKPGAGDAGGFPVDSLIVKGLDISARAPEGSASGKVSGGFEPGGGGSFSVAIETALIATNNWRAENARFDGDIELAPDGSAKLAGDVSGDFTADGVAARNVELSLDGGGASWRDTFAGGGALAGRAAISLASADIAVGESPTLGWLRFWRAPEQAPIENLSLFGELEIALADGRLTAAATGAPLRVVSDRAETLEIAPRNGAPLFTVASGTRHAAAAARISGPDYSGEGAFTAERNGGETWRFEASVVFDRQVFPVIAFGATRASAVGSYAGGVADADVVVSTLVERAHVGRIDISDTAVGSTLRIRTDFNAKEMQASNYEAACVDIKRARLALQGLNSDAQLSDSEFCRMDGPLAIVRWGEEPGAEFSGRLTARDSRLRLARTRFTGPPPEVEFAASYLSRPQLTEIEGAFSGGRVVLNDGLIGSDGVGRFTFRLDRDTMSGEAALDRVRVVQNRKLLFVAPLIAAGTARLADERIAFDYTASTLRGRRLGAGEGAHDIRTGSGATDFHSGELEFAPNGLQPASLVLALTGIISGADGAAAGDVHAEWGPKPEDFKTSGRFALDDVSFIGPGRAISHTGGVTGELKLTNLFPLKSDGPQSLEIKLLDLDSLIMENGVANFELPGDDTIHIINAEFPWYGGRIGAYDTVAAMTGERATTSLRAENVDLGALLDLAKVEGLSGEGRLSGVLPVVFEEGRARIVDGKLKSVGAGAIRYVGKATESAASSGAGAQVAFSILRDLQFSELEIAINGYLDGRINFVSRFVGTGEVAYNKAKGQLPVRYKITLDAALLELLKLAQTTQDVRLQIEEGRLPGEENVPKTPPPSQ